MSTAPYADMLDQDRADDVLADIIDDAHLLYRTVVFYSNGSTACYPHRDASDALAASRLHISADIRHRAYFSEVWDRMQSTGKLAPVVPAPLLNPVVRVEVHKATIDWRRVEYMTVIPEDVESEAL